MRLSCNHSSECTLPRNSPVCRAPGVRGERDGGRVEARKLSEFTVGGNGRLALLTGPAGEGRLCPSAPVPRHVRMETHLRAAHSRNQDQQVIRPHLTVTGAKTNL